MLLSSADAKRSVCRLETIGRTSGRPRELEIWFAADGDRVFLLSGGRDDAHWVRNLRVDPHVRIRVGGRWFTGTAREIEGQPEEPRARRLLAAKYQGWREGRPLSEWASESLPVAIDLAAQADGPV
ncbi:MAG: nitroreductase family deazaflavin-dependent oxidoreductase [Chloroflexota bacterium]|nr:nitroreductase family deazaflavin-dependent oxidoreductase [Chloroflexota bacterium]